MEPTSIYGYRYRPLTRTLHGKGASLVYYQLWINPGREQVLFEFLCFFDSFCFWRRVQRSPRELGVPKTPLAPCSPPSRRPSTRPWPPMPWDRCIQKKKFIADRVVCWKKADISRCHPLFPRQNVGCFLTLQTDLKQKRNLTSSYN